MKRWPRTSVAAVRAASICSLILLSGVTLGGPKVPPQAPPSVASSTTSAKLGEIPELPDAKAQASQIKSSPLYKDDSRLQSSNWLARSMQGLARWLENLFNRNDRSDRTGREMPALLGPWVNVVMWGILGALLAVFLYFAIKHFRWRLNLTRRSKALLEEDEPERTADEWLERADALEAEGKYREAVRCLYLACLLKFDEARVARFDRGQTNWEHLQRIHASPSLPPGVDFRPPTMAFDRIWYGMRVNGPTDVAQFREWYKQITASLLEKVAA